MRSRTSATSEIDRMYNALQCSIKPLDKSSAQYREIQAHFLRKKTVPCPSLPRVRVLRGRVLRVRC